MKRFINFRPLFLIFVIFVSTIFCVIKSFLNNYVPLVIFLVFMLCILILFVLSFFKKELFSNFCKIFSIKNLKLFCLIVLVSASVASLLAIFNFLHYSKRDFANGSYEITADVKEVSYLNGKTKLLLNHIKIDEKQYEFNIQASVDGEAEVDFAIGERLNFTAYIYASKLVQNGDVNTHTLKTGVQYYCSIDISTLTKADGTVGFVDALKDKTKSILHDNMNDDNAGLSYAVIFGDKSLLSNEYYEIFDSAGLAHILAVSGLHVGVLVAIISFVLKKLKVKPKVRFLAVFAILLIYNIMCSFAPSVFRASVMSLCLMLGLVLGERDDILSNISLAGIIVLMFQPLYLFDIGFLFSFGAVFAIILLSKLFENIFDKLKFPKFLSSSFSMTISATIGILPIMGLCSFKLVPFSIISNLVVLPIFSVMFILLLLFAFLSLIFSTPILLGVAEFFVNVVVSWSAVFAKFGAIPVMNFDVLCILIYYIILFFISPYFVMGKKSKLICTLAFLISFSSFIANCNTYKIINQTSISTYGSINNSLFLTTKSGKVVLSNIDSDDYLFNDIKTLMNKNRYKHINYIFVFNYNDEMQSNLAKIANHYKTEKIYIFGDFANSTKIGLVNEMYSANIIEWTNQDSVNIESDNFKVEYLSGGGKVKAVKFAVDGKNMVQILYAISESEIQNNMMLQTSFDCLFANRFVERYFDIDASEYYCKKPINVSRDVSIIVDDELWTYNF